MAIIKSGATTDTLTVDPLSKAARASLYDVAGNALAPSLTFAGIYGVVVRQSATTGAGAVVWGIHNPNATKTVLIRRASLDLLFDGTAAATLMKYELIKGTACTAFSAGATVTPLTKITGQTAIAVARVLDTGLTTTGATFAGSVGNMTMGRVTQTTTAFTHSLYTFDWGEIPREGIFLVQNEILALRQLATSVIGDNVLGQIEIVEYVT